MATIFKVYGPPGTGKTTYLLSKVQEELAHGIEPEQIIYTSFTRAAAIEARDRALGKFTSYNPDQFLWFSTIHSICFRKLGLKRENIFAGPRLREFSKQFPMYGFSADGTATDMNNMELPSGQNLLTTGDYFEFFISWYRNMMMGFDEAFMQFRSANVSNMPPGVIFTRERVIQYIKRRNEYKTSAGLFDFVDMIEMALSNQIYPSSNIKVMIVDEFQDQTPLLANLTLMWAQQAERFYLAGDPYQAIYQFAGADPSIFIGVKSDQDVVLKQSYRCGQVVHDLSRRVVSRLKSRYKDDDFNPTPHEGIIQRTWPIQVKWKDIIQSGEQVFYLHRTNYLVSLAYDELIQMGIPFTTVRGIPSPLQSSLVRAIIPLYKLLDGKHISATELQRITDHIPSRSEEKGMHQIQYLTHGSKTDIKKLADSSPTRNFTAHDLPKLGFTPDFMAKFNRDTMLSLLKITDDNRRYFMTMIRHFGTDILDMEPNLRVGTIHSVKGREADHVIINTNLTKKTSDALLADPDPEHRLFYVGITRARDNITIIQPDTPMKSYLL
jgi:ATP-dependent DNA helicase UvrD/PcrA